MGYRDRGKCSSELWAVVDKSGNVQWSRGGSSTPSRLLVYESEKKARMYLKRSWTKQVIDEQNVDVVKVYSVGE